MTFLAASALIAAMAEGVRDTAAKAEKKKLPPGFRSFLLHRLEQDGFVDSRKNRGLKFRLAMRWWQQANPAIQRHMLALYQEELKTAPMAVPISASADLRSFKEIDQQRSIQRSASPPAPRQQPLFHTED